MIARDSTVQSHPGAHGALASSGRLDAGHESMITAVICVSFPSFSLKASFWILDGFGSRLPPLGHVPWRLQSPVEPDTICLVSQSFSLLSEFNIDRGHSRYEPGTRRKGPFLQHFPRLFQIHSGKHTCMGTARGCTAGRQRKEERLKGAKGHHHPLFFSPSSVPHGNTPVFMPLRR